MKRELLPDDKISSAVRLVQLWLVEDALAAELVAVPVADAAPEDAGAVVAEYGFPL